MLAGLVPAPTTSIHPQTSDTGMLPFQIEPIACNGGEFELAPEVAAVGVLAATADDPSTVAAAAVPEAFRLLTNTGKGNVTACPPDAPACVRVSDVVGLVPVPTESLQHHASEAEIDPFQYVPCIVQQGELVFPDMDVDGSAVTSTV